MWIRQPEQVEQQVTPPIHFLMRTYQNGVKQAVVKRKIIQWLRVGEKVMLKIKSNNWKEQVAKRKRLKYLSVAEKSR